MEILILISLFFLGTVIASFLGVLIERLPKEKPVFLDRSRCDYCQKILSWKALVPIFSYLFFKGKTTCCHKSLPLYYPLFEIGVGGLFVLLYLLTPTWILFWYLVCVTSALVVITFTDIQEGVIPFPLILFLLAVSLGFNTYYYPTLLPYLLGMGIGGGIFGVIILATKGRGMGLGDLWFSLWMGLFLGYPKTILGIYLAFLTGAIVSLILIIAKKKKFKGETIPFGPFLVLGTILAYFYGQTLLALLLPYIT